MERPSTVFTDVTWIGADGELRSHQTVVVSGDRIAWVGAASEARPDPGATRIDAAGRYLVPGLIDAHVHATEKDLPLFLARGVTTIRELNGSEEHLLLRERIAAGAVLGPDLIVYSPLLAGVEQRWRHLLLSEPEVARARALEFVASGYDGLKIYDGLSEEVYATLVEVAEEAGIPLTGHIPDAVGLDDVLAVGQGIEHVEQIVYRTVGRDFDHARIAGIVERIAAAGVPVTPTLAAQKFLRQARTSAFAARLELPEMRFVDADTFGWWRSLGPRDEHSARMDGAESSPFYAFQCELVRALSEAGVPLLLGTDTPNPLLVPGYSVYEEILALSDAGLSPGAILRACTTTAARQLGLGGDRGAIAVGLRADLILVRDNPLLELATLSDPLGTMVAGRWLDAAALADLLGKVATR